MITGNNTKDMLTLTEGEGYAIETPSIHNLCEYQSGPMARPAKPMIS